MNYEKRQRLLEASDALEDAITIISDIAWEENDSVQAMKERMKCNPHIKSMETATSIMTGLIEEIERVQNLVIAAAKTL